jgi:N-acetylneuraminic acid mutarotase
MNLRIDKVMRIALYFPLFVFAILLTLTRCEDETAKPREYPRLTGMQIVNISDSGATFIADLYSLGSETITEHGFLWSTGSGSTITGSNRIYLGKPGKTGLFTADIRSGLTTSIEYHARPFVITEERTIYGPSVKFTSLGSNAPLIQSFEPLKAGWDDTIRVTGRNFSWIASKNEIFLNDVKCNVVRSTDTTLVFVVNSDISAIDNFISVALAGNKSAYTKDKLVLIAPQIMDFYPKQGFWGDTISIKGKKIRYVTQKQTNSVRLGNVNCPVIYSSISDTLIKVLVPFEINNVTNPVSVIINGLTSNNVGSFTLLPPSFTFSPPQGTWGSTVTLNGRFNTLTSRNAIYFNSLPASIKSVTSRNMTLTVPLQLQDQKSLIRYSVSPFNITPADSFALFNPVIKSITPLSGASGNSVTIRGKYFSTYYNSTSVKFGTFAGTFSVLNDSTIITVVPPNVTGKIKIAVKCFSLIAYSDQEFESTNPLISGFYPKSATFNEEITVEGKYLVYQGHPELTMVRFGNLFPSNVVSATDTKIIVNVSTYLDSIPSKINVFVNGTSASSAEDFTLTPPEITGISSFTTAGQDIVITGNGFNPLSSSNIVRWDVYPLKVKSSTATQIVAEGPAIVTRGNSRIRVSVGGYNRNFPINNAVNSYWSHVILQAGLSWVSSAGLDFEGVGFALNDKGYMIDRNVGSMISYDPSIKNFSSLGNHSQFRSDGVSVVVCNDIAYMTNYYSGLYRYNTSTGSWVSTGASSPISGYKYHGVFFSLNNKIYYGLTSNSPYSGSILNRTLWELGTISNSWTQKQSMPAITSKFAVTSFSMNNKGYVLFSDNKFCEYDPETDSWTQLQNYPGSVDYYGRNSMVINNKAYVGFGRTYSGSTFSDDLYTYDRTSNSWTFFCKIPFGGRMNAVSFVVNNKGYIGPGYLQNGGNQIKDLLEFDPSSPMK